MHSGADYFIAAGSFSSASAVTAPKTVHWPNMGNPNKSGARRSASSAATLDAVDAKIVQLLLQIRPEAVALTDAFGFLDSQLKSAIGRSGRTPSDCLDLDRRGVLIEV